MAEGEQEEATQQAEAEEQKAQQEEDQQSEEDEPRAVSSSMVAEVGYDRESEEVNVVFDSGREESYSCSPAQWEGLKEAPSVGKYMHETFL